VGSDRAVFVGIAPASQAANYLAGSRYASVDEFTADPRIHNGQPAVPPPAGEPIWAVQASGPGPQTVTWTAMSGQWTVVT
jgi:hypothetical protein